MEMAVKVLESHMVKSCYCKYSVETPSHGQKKQPCLNIKVAYYPPLESHAIAGLELFRTRRSCTEVDTLDTLLHAGQELTELSYRSRIRA